MKPFGTVPSAFGVQDGELSIGGKTANELVDANGGTPLFVYDHRVVDTKIAHFRAEFRDVHLHSAIKANPYRPLIKHMLPQVDGLDVASAGELRLLVEVGADPRAISFAGPGKRDEELAYAIEQGATLNCESEGEVARVLDIAKVAGITPRLAVRVNPDFEIKGSGMRMGGGAKPFGVDADRVPALLRKIADGGAEYRGLHIYAGSQALDADALIDAQTASVDLAAELSSSFAIPPPIVNLGGGFGIPYFPGDKPLDIVPVATALHNTIAKHRHGNLANTEFAIELGRWLVGECGVYLTRVVDRKVSKGVTFIITDGGLHHQLAASGNFGQVIRRNYPVAIASRFDAEPVEEVNIVGCLCTPLDRLADEVMMPRAEVGDIVAVFMAGAYGLSASPQAFLGQPKAREILI